MRARGFHASICCVNEGQPRLVDCGSGSPCGPTRRRHRPWTASDCARTSFKAGYDDCSLVDPHSARCRSVHQVIDRIGIAGCGRVVCGLASLPVVIANVMRRLLQVRRCGCLSSDRPSSPVVAKITYHRSREIASRCPVSTIGRRSPLGVFLQESSLAYDAPGISSATHTMRGPDIGSPRNRTQYRTLQILPAASVLPSRL